MKSWLSRWNDTTLFKKFCYASIPVASLSLLLLISFGSKLSPENTSYQQKKYNVKAAESIAYTNLIVKRCIEEETAKKPKECDHLKEILELSQGALDLAAQESMANSTFHLSRITYWQYLANGLTVIFLMMTVGASYAFLYEASQATKFARDTLTETKRATNYELKPYISIKFKGGGYHVNSHLETSIPCQLRITNSGQTPAYSVHVSISSGPGAIGVFFLPNLGHDSNEFENTPLVFYRSEDTDFSIVELIGGDNPMHLWFPKSCWKTDCEEWDPETAEVEGSSWTAPAYTYWKTIINNLEIRFKDIECGDADRHKLIKAGVLASGDDWTDVSVYDWEFRPDNEHNYYRKLAEQRANKKARGFL